MLYIKLAPAGSPPDTWGESIVKWTYKKGNPQDPRNCQKCSLKNVMGKTFHLIISEGTTNFHIANDLIDRTLQKEFFAGVSGCTDHNMMMLYTAYDFAIDNL